MVIVPKLGMVQWQARWQPCQAVLTLPCCACARVRRLLQADPVAAERAVVSPVEAVPWFSEALGPEARDAVFSEFNTLSVIFQQVGCDAL